MTVVVTSWFFLMLLALLIRRRFTSRSPFSLFLKIPGVSQATLLMAILLFSVTYSFYMINNAPDNLFQYVYVIAPILSTAVFAGLIAFFITRGPISNTYFSDYHIRDICIDINKNFIPPLAITSKYEREKFIENFVKKIISEKYIYRRNVIIKSHLISPGFRNLISKALEKEKIIFSCEEYYPTRSEKITLNLWYGGKTRYRIFSLKRHDNGFKVHERGSIFKISVKH